jgi:hypothetical protein
MMTMIRFLRDTQGVISDETRGVTKLRRATSATWFYVSVFFPFDGLAGVGFLHPGLPPSCLSLDSSCIPPSRLCRESSP